MSGLDRQNARKSRGETGMRGPARRQWPGRQWPVLLGAGVIVLLVAVVAVAATRGGPEDGSRGPGAADIDQPVAVATITGATETFPETSGQMQQEAVAPQLQPQPAAGSLAGKIIAIDPGHAANADSGFEPIGPGSSETKVKDPGGTSGAATGVREPVVTLAISRYLKQMLEAEGARVVMTRESDTFYGGNRERAQVANQAQANLFIRIHCDGSGNPATSGVSTLYPALIPGWTDDIYAASLKAAQTVQPAMVRNLGATDRGVVERSNMTGFNWADVPAILVEAGFMSNADEDVRLNSPQYQQAVAGALLTGIKDYFSS